MNKNRKIKVGIVGAGFIGKAHIEALSRIGVVEVAAIVDKDINLAGEIAEKWGIKYYYSDYEELMENGEVEAVHVTLPNKFHLPVARLALEHDKHVLCEKPLTRDLAEAKELCAAAGKSGRIAALSYNLRYYPLVQQARSMVQNGELGKVFACHGNYLQDWLLFKDDYSWRLDEDANGSMRAIADIGSHWMDMIEYTLGQRITEVCADVKTFIPVRRKYHANVQTFSNNKSGEYDEINIKTDDYAALLMRFADGTAGSAVINQAAAGRKNQLTFEIDGSLKSLCWNSEHPNELFIGNRDSFNQYLIKDPALMAGAAAKYASYPGGHAEGYPDTLKQLFNEVYDHILNGGGIGTAGFPTFEDGKHKMALCEAVITSGKQRCWVSVED